MNINYLAVSALHHYAHLPGPHQHQATQLYHRLRNNVIKTVYGAGYLLAATVSWS